MDWKEDYLSFPIEWEEASYVRKSISTHLSTHKAPDHDTNTKCSLARCTWIICMLNKEREIRRTVHTIPGFFIEKEANLEFKILSPPKGRHINNYKYIQTFCTLPNSPSLSSKLLSFHRNPFIATYNILFHVTNLCLLSCEIKPCEI